MESAGKEKFDGDLLGDEHKGSFAKICEKACAAVEADYDAERTAHMSYGEYPAKEYLQHITGFRYFRIYEIARLIGVKSGVSDELIESMWDQMSPVADQWRQMGVFGPEIHVPDDASTEDKLLGLSGRDPLAF